MDDLFQDENNTKTVDYTELVQQVVYRAKIVLRSYWWVFPLAIALGISFKVVEIFVQEPFYKSTSQMLVSARIALPENNVYAEERDNFFGTQIELMLSAQVQACAVERIRLVNLDLYNALMATEAYINRQVEMRSNKSERTHVASVAQLEEFSIYLKPSIFVGEMDAVLFAIRCAYNQVRQIKPALARLAERNVDVSGLILNDVDTTQPGYYYSEYYTDNKSNHRPPAQETSA